MGDLMLFVKPGCPYCAAAKDDLQRRGIRYIERDVHDDPGALQQMLELNGHRRHVPTIVHDGQVTVGFHGY